MSRLYDEVVQVQLGRGGAVGNGWLSTPEAASAQGLVPTAFLWRGKLHLVQEVISQWTQRLPWWQSAWEDSDSAPTLERQVWRVEARAGRDANAGVYDLAQGQPWQVLGVAD